MKEQIKNVQFVCKFCSSNYPNFFIEQTAELNKLSICNLLFIEFDIFLL